MLFNLIRKTIEDTLNKLDGGDVNPVSVRIGESHLRMLIFSTINGTFINSKLEDVDSILSFMHSLDLIGDCSISYYQKNKQILSNVLKEFLTIHNQYTVDDISVCYDSLLTSEVYIFGGVIAYKTQKDRRDMAGSYYTPNLLALNTVKKALNAYFEKNSAPGPNVADFNMKIIDPSCGCGEFLVMCRKCLIEDYSLQPDRVSSWFYGADVDPIAIQIAMARLYPDCEISDLLAIRSHFFVGNSLYRGISSDIQSKFRMFSEGRLYSKDNGVLEKITECEYDIVVGNPPWEKVRFEDRKFFRQYSSEIADITKKSEREQCVNQLKKQNEALYLLYLNQNNDYSSFKGTILDDGFLTKSVLGELNTYALFTELSLCIMKRNGVCGLILKSSLMTSPVYSPMFRWLMDAGLLSNILFFNNSKKIFDIDSREQFCVAIFASDSSKISVSFGLTEMEDLNRCEMLELSKSDLATLNPLTYQIPGIQSNEQFSLLIGIHRRCPLFSEVFSKCHFGRLVHLTSHSEYISSVHDNNNIPILEGKMIGLYTSHYSSFSNVSEEKKYSHKAKSKSSMDAESFEHQCRLFIEKDAWQRITKNYRNEYSLYWRSLTSSTNSRTMIATIDRHMPSSQSVQLLQCDDLDDLFLILSIFNSSTFDKILRMKLCGIDLTQKIIKQMPVPSRDVLMHECEYEGVCAPIRDHLIVRVRTILKDVFGECTNDFAVSSDRYKLMADIDKIVAVAYSVWF